MPGVGNQRLRSINRIENDPLPETVLTCTNHELNRVANYMSGDLRRIFVSPGLSASYSTNMSLVAEWKTKDYNKLEFSSLSSKAGNLLEVRINNRENPRHIEAHLNKYVAKKGV